MVKGLSVALDNIRSRHNVGFDCIDHMSKEWSIRLSDRRAKAVIGQGRLEGVELVLAKPRTFMNRSGEGVAYLLSRFRAGPQDLVVVYDDLDLPLGKIRVRLRGDAAGHNGVKSIIAALSTQEFARVRVGIDKPPPDVDGVEHVLRPFPAEQRKVVSEAVVRVAQAVACLLMDGPQEAMNRFN